MQSGYIRLLRRYNNFAFQIKILFFEDMEAAVQRCSVEKMFLKIPANLLKKRLCRWCFPGNFAKFL